MHVSHRTCVLKMFSHWAVRQPRYKSSCCATACEQGLQRQRRLELADAHLGPHSQQNDDFGALQTVAAVPASIRNPDRNGCAAHGHMLAEKRLAALRQRGKTTICLHKTSDERNEPFAVRQGRERHAVVVAVRVFCIFWMVRVVCPRKCTRTTVETYWVGSR